MYKQEKRTHMNFVKSDIKAETLQLMLYKYKGSILVQQIGQPKKMDKF